MHGNFHINAKTHGKKFAFVLFCPLRRADADVLFEIWTDVNKITQCMNTLKQYHTGSSRTELSIIVKTLVVSALLYALAVCH